MRKFNLVDLMAVIAATGVGLVLVRSLGLQFDWKTLFLGLPDNQSGFYALRYGIAVVLALTPILGLWTMAVLILRLRRPRPALRRLTRQPGLIAGIAVALTIAIGVVNLAVATVITWAHHGWSITAPYSSWQSVVDVVTPCLLRARCSDGLGCSGSESELVRGAKLGRPCGASRRCLLDHRRPWHSLVGICRHVGLTSSVDRVVRWSVPELDVHRPVEFFYRCLGDRGRSHFRGTNQNRSIQSVWHG